MSVYLSLNQISRLTCAILLSVYAARAADQSAGIPVMPKVVQALSVTAAFSAEEVRAEIVELGSEGGGSGLSEKAPARKFDIGKYPSNGAGQFASSVPLFRAKSVAGAEYRGEDLYSKRGLLMMISAPNLTQCEKQKRWEKVLKKEAWPEANAPRCVVIEDMSQAGGYRDKVRQMMIEKTQKDDRVLFILDEEGDLRRQFGVMENETVILVVDAAGNVVHHECDDVEPERESARRVMAQVYRLADARTQSDVPIAASNTER